MTSSTDCYDITDLVEALQAPEAYPHPVRTIQVVQTHTACVFLTGDYAYKIKKPVRFNFLDYRTLEQRRAYCEQELVLNRRLCPDIYLDVLPITWQQNHIEIDGDGPVIEWAVRMRQLRETDMLPARLQADTLDKTVIEHLAHLLAVFHNQAHTDDTVRAFGSPASISATISMTLHTMQQVTEGTSRAVIHQALSAYFARFQEEQASLLRERLSQNRIRDCHGDLRAQNICLDARFSGGVQIFDCIEFNPSFRCIDTAADIAYLAMDLDLAGRADLRAHLLETYSREANDESLTRILPFYLAYRAMVRGNIALLAARESEIPSIQQHAHQALADAAYDLARSYASHPPRPLLLITVGFSGSGKSALAQELCRRLPAIHLATDNLRKERAGIEITAPLEQSHYTLEQRSAVYDAMFQAADTWLARNEHVLLDATFLDPRRRQDAAALAQERGAEFWIILCQCPDAVIRQRLAVRAGEANASDAGLDVYLQQRHASEDLDLIAQNADAPGCCVRADMTCPVSEVARTIMTRLLCGDDCRKNDLARRMFKKI